MEVMECVTGPGPIQIQIQHVAYFLLNMLNFRPTLFENELEGGIEI
jgi:hypothetical protein